MPLTYEERRRVNDVLNGVSAPAVMGDTDGGGSGLDRLAGSIARLCDMIAPVLERATNGASVDDETGLTAPATDAPRRRGRKAGTVGGDSVAATPTPGATAAVSPPATAAQSVATPAPAAPTPAPTDGGGFGLEANPLDDNPAAGDGLALPGFLDRNKQEAAPQPAKEYTAAEVRDVLKKYMDKKGGNNLTVLLERIAKVKKFAECPPAKWTEVVNAAKAEAGL